jgi:hypothetical protein
MARKPKSKSAAPGDARGRDHSTVTAAVAAVAGQLANLRDGDDVDVSQLVAEMQWAKSGLIGRGGVNVDVAERLIAAAKSGDADADTILRGGIAISLRFDWPLPLCLKLYAADALAAGIRVAQRQQQALKNRRRDLEIALAVYVVSKDFGFLPTRNYAAHDVDGAAESACSIVARALARNGIHMSEGAVAKIWEKMGYLRS